MRSTYLPFMLHLHCDDFILIWETFASVFTWNSAERSCRPSCMFCCSWFWMLIFFSLVSVDTGNALITACSPTTHKHTSVTLLRYNHNTEKAELLRKRNGMQWLANPINPDFIHNRTQTYRVYYEHVSISLRLLQRFSIYPVDRGGCLWRWCGMWSERELPLLAGCAGPQGGPQWPLPCHRGPEAPSAPPPPALLQEAALDAES